MSTIYSTPQPSPSCEPAPFNGHDSASPASCYMHKQPSPYSSVLQGTQPAEAPPAKSQRRRYTPVLNNKFQKSDVNSINHTNYFINHNELNFKLFMEKIKNNIPAEWDNNILLLIFNEHFRENSQYNAFTSSNTVLQEVKKMYNEKSQYDVERNLRYDFDEFSSIQNNE